jgi:hypothetical protein
MLPSVDPRAPTAFSTATLNSSHFAAHNQRSADKVAFYIEQ